MKDADATAIYGSRGANGVILITTKKGKTGKTMVDVNVYTGMGKISRRLKLLNTPQYLQMRREAFKNDGVAPNPNTDFDLSFWDTTRYTDWQKVLIGNSAHFTNAQASVSGGNANTQFLVGMGYADQGTVYLGNYGDKKASVHLNLTNISTDQRFVSQLALNYINDNNRLPLSDYTSNGILFAPNSPALYDDNGNLNWQLKGGNTTFFNPLAATRNLAKALSDNLISNVAISYRIFKDLQVTSNFGYNHSQMNQSIVTLGLSAKPGSDLNYARSNSTGTGDRKTWIVEPQLNYHHQVGNMAIEALIGSTFQESIQSSISQHVSDFSSDALTMNPQAASYYNKPSYSYTQYKYNALYGRLGLDWKQRYVLNLTARRDGSSHFGPGKQFGNFGAAGAAWIFSSERFIGGKLPWLSFGKIRVSYGITGNDNLTDYQYLSTYSVSNATYQETTPLSPSGLTNPYYAWEQNKKLEVGLELGFLKDRILVTASHYRNTTENQLVGYPLPYITGFTTVQYNLPAIIRNTGFEFTVRGDIIKDNDVSWNSSVNYSIPQNKLVSYPDFANSSYYGTYVVGQSLFVRYLFHYTGVDPQMGSYSYATKSGNRVPDFFADRYFKSVTQASYGGWQNTFNYKGVQLDVFIQFVKQLGANILASSYSMPGTMVNQPIEVLARWQHPGDVTNIQQFSIYNGPANNAFSNIYLSDAAITDASFVRVKNIAISFQLPRGRGSKSYLQKAQIYFQGQNLFTITHYRGADPETQGKSLPPLKVLTMGARLSF